jgi:hypothetical protein
MGVIILRYIAFYDTQGQFLTWILRVNEYFSFQKPGLKLSKNKIKKGVDYFSRKFQH